MISGVRQLLLVPALLALVGCSLALDPPTFADEDKGPADAGDGGAADVTDHGPAADGAAPGPLGALIRVGPFAEPAPSWGDAQAWQPDSATIVARLGSVVTAAVGAFNAYGVSVAWATASDPMVTVTNTNGWGTEPSGGSFRCPSTAAPAAGTEAQLVVVQPDGSLWELWNAARQPQGDWTAGGVAHAQAGAHGYPVAGCRGSSFTLAAGAIDPQEIAAGHIEHALTAVLPAAVVRPYYVEPSNDSDGEVERSDNLPEGARLVLDPSASLAGLSALETVVAQALKDYGAFVADKTSGTDLSFVGIAPETWTAVGEPDPWAAPGLGGYPSLDGLVALIPKMRVVKYVGLTPK